MTRSDSTHPVEALSAYLDGELSPSEVAELELHVRGCAECGVALEGLRLLSRAVAEEELPPLPADLAGRITRRLEPGRPVKSAPRARRLTGFFGAPLAAAAAAVLAAGVLWTVWQSREVMTVSRPVEVAEQEMSEREGSAGRRFAPDADKKAAMAEAAPEAETLEEDDSVGRRELGARQESFSVTQGPETGGARADLATPGDSPDGVRKEAAGYAPSPPVEPRTTPPPTVAKAAPAESVKDEEAGRLHEPGHVSSAEAEPEAAAPERIQEEQKVEVRDGLAYVTPGEGAVPPTEAGVAQSSPRMKQKRADRPMAVAAEVAPRNQAEQDLVLREPGYEIRLAPSGEMTVSAGEYACTVSPDEMAPSVAGESMEEDASQADRLDLQQEGEAPGGAGSPVEFYESAVSGTAGGESDPERSLLLILVRGPYREALERKCGPLPEPLAGDPEQDP